MMTNLSLFNCLNLFIIICVLNAECRKNDNLDLIVMKILQDRSRNNNHGSAPPPAYVPVYINSPNCQEEKYPLYVPM